MKLKLRKLKIWRRSNEALVEKSQNLEIVLKSITAGVISLDEENNIVAVNKAAENLLMIDAQLAEGTIIRRNFLIKNSTIFWSPLEARIATGKLYQGQVDLSELGREAVLIVRGVQIKDDEDRVIGAVVVVDDAQDQVRAQKLQLGKRWRRE